ncbi:LuxR C-terminal-related transcriptional regulator [Leptolyngbya sp. FACHB-261]|uniref:helix-turn-helix transcriptional regulator n=1 Tax=Leptolyngbya sp. FACHB-261 TaxID=2692806 RepID=UPI0018EFB2AD|nr:LuxR C-terminal-related transcriptional regulator [Leptolyngbya sp. FACHB-261]
MATNLLERPDAQTRPVDSTLLQGVVEGFIDGILILSEQGEWIRANECARRICHQLAPSQLTQSQLIQSRASALNVPKAIWRVCQTLIDSRDLYPNQPVIVEDDIVASRLSTIRVRARWFRSEAIRQPCLLVTLEDRYQTLQNMALAEAHEYSLTPREAEIWLLYRANYKRQEIADKLYITLNTVKKHLKNIQAKRQATLDEEE